jgi:DNA-binding NtrC family response regulator
VFESEMFGHVKGAFTDAKTDRIGYFELADQGTLFLDEIGNMPPLQQAKLLRVLQTGEFQRVGTSRTRKVDVRVIAATNIDIAREVAEGRFREDLLYRLNTVEIHLPPLRDRAEDIPRLAAHFLAQDAARYGKRITGIEPDAMRALADYHWPGNVRELQHVMERAVLMAQGDAIRVEDLLLRPRAGDGASRLEEMTLDEAERWLIRKALARAQGNVSRAADALGLSRSALYRRLQQHGITP